MRIEMDENRAKELEKECICPTCPTYADCKEHIAFCIYGISTCITTKQGCICPACPVYEKLELDRMYYCIK